MRVVVVGATGNVGSSTLRALSLDPTVSHLVGVARRVPREDRSGVEWRAADIAVDDLTPMVLGADAVVDLAWALEPVKDAHRLHATNIVGSARLFEAVVAGGVQTLVYASSVGAYSPAPDGGPVGEEHPTHGAGGSRYALQKAYVERVLDRFELVHPEVRVVRMRTALCVKAEAAAGQCRVFLGEHVPLSLLRGRHVPMVPEVPGLVVQAVHTDDAAEAYRRAVTTAVSGPFNVAADPPLGAADVALLLGARRVKIPPRVFPQASRAARALHLAPSEPGWFDLALASPLLDTARARKELGWEPRRSALAAVAETFRALGLSTADPSDAAAPG